MKLFFHVVRLSLQQQITYRAAILAGLATNFFFALLRVSLLVALYHGKAQVNGLTLQDSISYVAVSQAMIAFLFIFGSTDVMASVYSGAVGADLLKPMHLLVLWMARDLGRSLVNFVGRGIVLMALMALVYPLILPSQPAQWLALLAALSLGWLVSFAWRFLVNLAAFWSPDARGIGRIAFTISQLLAGFLMPLRLYPDWFIQLCRLTPFPALFNTATEIYLGVLYGPEILTALINQLGWLLVLLVLCEVLMAAGVRRLVIQGG